MMLKTDLLKKHIFDTVKEWQMKIGYQKGNMCLYYPSASLITLLGLNGNTTETELTDALNAFGKAVRDQLGPISVTHEGDRYCVSIPEEGCDYIAKNIPDPEFLKSFLRVITTKGCSMDMVRGCFSNYAGQHGVGYVEADHSMEGLGHDFYFDKEGIDDYIYCVEADDFGLTYHRFTREDYEMLQAGDRK